MKNRYWMSFALSAAILAGMAAGCGSETVSESEPGSSSESAGEARKATLVFVAPSDTPYADDADNAEVMDLIHDQFLADRNIDLEIQIKDSGVGIPDVEQARTPLFTTGNEERSGMGFTIMESFMDTVKVRSAVGKGTTVTMRRRIALRVGGGQ